MKIGRIVRLTWKEDKHYIVILQVKTKDTRMKPVTYSGIVISNPERDTYIGEEFWFNSRYWNIEILKKDKAFLEIL